MRDLQRINRELGITTIVNLHFLDLAQVYGERVIGLRAGEMVYDGTGAEADEDVFRDIYGRSLTADDILSVQVLGRTMSVAARIAPRDRAAPPPMPRAVPAGFMVFVEITLRSLDGPSASASTSGRWSPTSPAGARSSARCFADWPSSPHDRAHDRDGRDGRRRGCHRLRHRGAAGPCCLTRHHTRAVGAQPGSRACST